LDEVEPLLVLPATISTGQRSVDVAVGRAV
jgi:hypothetical protein